MVYQIETVLNPTWPFVLWLSIKQGLELNIQERYVNEDLKGYSWLSNTLSSNQV